MSHHGPALGSGGGQPLRLEGQTPVVAATGKRFVGTTITAISTQGARWLMVFRENSTVGLFLRYLRQLCGPSSARST